MIGLDNPSLARLAELRYGGLDWEELLHIGDVNEAEET